MSRRRRTSSRRGSPAVRRDDAIVVRGRRCELRQCGGDRARPPAGADRPPRGVRPVPSAPSVLEPRCRRVAVRVDLTREAGARARDRAGSDGDRTRRLWFWLAVVRGRRPVPRGPVCRCRFRRRREQQRRENQRDDPSQRLATGRLGLGLLGSRHPRRRRSRLAEQLLNAPLDPAHRTRCRWPYRDRR